MQKRVITIISKLAFDSHSDPMFEELELQKRSDIKQLELGKLIFYFNHSHLPSNFNNYFYLINKQVHTYAIRYANDFHRPSSRTNLRKFSVSFQGPTYYNSVENYIKESNFEVIYTLLHVKSLVSFLFTSS